MRQRMLPVLNYLACGNLKCELLQRDCEVNAHDADAFANFDPSRREVENPFNARRNQRIGDLLR